MRNFLRKVKIIKAKRKAQRIQAKRYEEALQAAGLLSCEYPPGTSKHYIASQIMDK